jgi:peptidyl-prolyl cis-trans isomerase C
MRWLCAVALLFIGCTRNNDASGSRLVVKVNDWSLTAQELSEQIGSEIKDLPTISARDESLIRRAKESLVQSFIVRSVVKDYAVRNNIFVRKEALDAEAKKIRDQYPDDLAFRKALSDSGRSYEHWLAELKGSMLEKLVLVEIMKTTPRPNEAEIKSFYEQNKSSFAEPPKVRIRQIILETEEQAKNIRTELSRGKKFEDLAKKYSIGAEASSGGDLGWIERGVSEMFDYAFRLGVGQKSQIIKTPLGYTIYELRGRKEAKTLSLAEAKPRIERQLLAQKEQLLYSKWLEAELLSARVFKDDELIQAIQVHARSTK